ncbi:uncharacterized protein SPAPADRAFT_56102 [Spathaspora passalidarum NRRL Y-27907]|uniref:Uncharacterized protein n=1 Tax=Spathaspora passalidarum (strain NRRL Y-27907 / 11-Y1) TaxID=619300 RepID=G3AQY1_SPAPN|nr:uncharacterized protein SPAPADRAFT_56102 [Spathaspora passalidarum NRRL Y-27907]EGW31210.1 hypothetical protein SPAPADRAFT_56102 [Spathaspora passalidarum NRRL Y-27907]
MAVTRSQDKAKKIVFEDNEDEEESVEIEARQEEEDKEPESEEESESESESDDEAPEEESTNKTKQEVLAQQKKREQEQKAQKNAERERRRQLDLRNKQQQESKKATKIEEEALPDLLPDDIMDILSTPEPEETQSKIKGKHIRLDEVELDKKKEIEDKLRKIKLQKKMALKKGPVHVQVQKFGKKSEVVPKSENKIIASRDKWLKRKSVNRK